MPDEHEAAPPPDAWDELPPDEKEAYLAAGYDRASYNEADRAVGEFYRKWVAAGRPTGCPRPGRYGEE
jgi:hypothetical protein